MRSAAPILKEAWEIEVMREAGRIAAEALRKAVEAVRPGASTMAAMVSVILRRRLVPVSRRT